MDKTSIVFIGAGPVAAESLRQIHSNFNIEAVITKKKADHHKDEPPVNIVAKKINALVLEANSKSELDSIIENNNFKSQVAVLIDYGVIVSETAINSFPKGIINSHFSLLPEWRGADPITFSLLSGQRVTGVSLMLLSAGMDEGPIIDQKVIEIEPSDTGASLTEKLVKLSSSMLAEDLEKYLNGNLTPVNQAEYASQHSRSTTPTYSSKLTKASGRIDWTKPAESIEREIRAYQPWPKSYAEISNNLTVTIVEATIDKNLRLNPGELKRDGNVLFIGTATEALKIIRIQPAGKKVMSCDEFLRGYLNKIFVQ